MIPDKRPFKIYYGGKGSNGTYQSIINEILPHKILMIPFLGNCAVTRNIKRSNHTYLNDVDKKVIQQWKKVYCKNNSFHFYNLDFRKFIRSVIDEILSQVQQDKIIFDTSSIFIYCDPPYLKHTRKSINDIYDYELTEQDHFELLEMLKNIPVNVMISAIQNPLYDQELNNWNRIKYKALTRGGAVIETMYTNYKLDSGKLHDYSHLGKDCTDRQRIKRKIKGWINKLNNLNAKERSAIIESIKQNGAQ